MAYLGHANCAGLQRKKASAMDLSETFRSHAKECRRAAASADDAEGKATWTQMAQRWLACAEHYEEQHSAPHQQAETHYRRKPPGWAQKNLISTLAHRGRCVRRSRVTRMHMLPRVFGGPGGLLWASLDHLVGAGEQ